MTCIARATLALAVVAAAGSGAFAQPANVFVPNADAQTELFRGLFDFHQIKPVDSSEIRKITDYRNLIVVVFGNRPNQTINDAARAALSNGGAVLIADRNALDVAAFLPEHAEVSVSGSPVFAGVGNGQPRGGNPPAPVTWVPVVPVEPGPLDLGGRVDPRLNRPEMELFTPFRNIAADQPSHLDIRKRPSQLARNVAVFPAGTMAFNTNKPLVADRQPFAAAGAGDARNPFRCVAMADTGLLTNRMMYTSAPNRGNTDNLRFANALVQWLKGPEGRTRCLFVENGIVLTEFDKVKYSAIPTGTPMPQVPPPQLPNPFDPELQRKLSDMGNEVIARVEDENVFNNALADTNDRKAVTYRTAAILGLIVLYALTRLRAVRQRFLALFRPIPKDPLRLGADTPVGSLEHRRLEMLRGGDYAVPVRAYVRALFEDRGLPTGYAADKLPPVEFDLRNTDFLKGAIRTLWAEARSDKPINYSRWKQLEPLLAGVRAAADDDRWRFVPPDERGAA